MYIISAIDDYRKDDLSLGSLTLSYGFLLNAY